MAFNIPISMTGSTPGSYDNKTNTVTTSGGSNQTANPEPVVATTPPSTSNPGSLPSTNPFSIPLTLSGQTPGTYNQGTNTVASSTPTDFTKVASDASSAYLDDLKNKIANSTAGTSLPTQTASETSLVNTTGSPTALIPTGNGGVQTTSGVNPFDLSSDKGFQAYQKEQSEKQAQYEAQIASYNQQMQELEKRLAEQAAGQKSAEESAKKAAEDQALKDKLAETPKINASYTDRAGAAPAWTSDAVMGNRAGNAPTWEATSPYQKQGSAMQAAAEKSYGGSAADALKMAMGAGQDYAANQADRAAANAGRQSTAYARASGMSPAQAALMAGQQSGDLYNTAYSTNLSDAVRQYGNLAGQMGSLGTAQEGLGLQQYQTDVAQQTAKNQAAANQWQALLGADTSKYQTDVAQNTAKNQMASNQWQSLLGADTSKYGIDVGADTSRYGIDKGVQQQNQQSGFNFLGGLLSGGAALLGLSDETAKEDIKDGYGILERVTKTVGPKTFKYKAGVGEDPTKERVGVMAQDLEKTPLASVVQTGEDGLKRVDTGQLSLGNTAMISELSKKVDMLAKFLKGAEYA